MPWGRALIVIGLLVASAGVLVLLVPDVARWFGHLPGDVVIRGQRHTIYLPFATSLLLSVLLTLVIWLLRR